MKARKGYKLYQIDLDIWHYRVYIVFAKDMEAAAKDLKLTGDHSPDFFETAGAACFHVRGDGTTYMFFPEKNKVNASDVAHEAWHVTRRLLKYVDAELDNETVAYHIGFLVRTIMKLAGKR